MRILGVAVLLAACGKPPVATTPATPVTPAPSEGVPGMEAGNDPRCPRELPTVDTACEHKGLTCRYPCVDDGREETVCVHDELRWLSYGCTPPGES